MQAALVAAPRPAPGPVGWPLIGMLFHMGRDPLAYITDVSRTYGGIAAYQMGTVRNWLITDPEAIEVVLTQYRDVMHKDAITNGLSRLLGEGLVTSEGSLWKQQRKLIAPSFQPRQLASYADTMVDAARTHADSFVDGTRDVHEDMNAIALDIVLRTLFGTAAREGALVGRTIDTFMVAFEHQIRSIERLFPAWVPTPARRRIAAARADIVHVLDTVIADRLRTGEGGDDMLSRLLAARDEDGNGMSEAQLRDEAVTLFVAGHETTALNLSYALWLLAHDPQVQQELAAERQAVLQGKPATGKDVPKLVLHAAVVQEAMRLYPPAWMMGRTPTEPIEVKGHTIAVGEQILMPQWVVHRDPAHWPNPDQFDPSRWLGDNAPASRVHRFAFFPFGGGARVCIGNHFAKMEAVLVLATWLQGRSVAPAPGAILELMPAVTLRPRHGVRLVVSAPLQ